MGRGLGLRAIATYGPAPLWAWAEAAVALGRIPIFVPAMLVYWELTCIDECDTCRDSGKGYFSYP
jgi:hypothetical protein